MPPLARIFFCSALVACSASSSKGGFAPDAADDDAGETPSDAGADGPSIHLGDAYFFYLGEGSVGALGDAPACGKSTSFGAWRALLAPATIDAKDAWPADLYAYRVIVFDAPASLGAAERDKITDWARSGGTLFVMTDYGTGQGAIEGLSASNQAMNALLQSMGASITIDDALATNGAYALPLDPASALGANVAANGLACSSGTTLTIAAPAAAVDTRSAAGKAVLAAQPIGAGRVVVLADQTCAADSANAGGEPCAATPEAAARLGAFLKNLAR